MLYRKIIKIGQYFTELLKNSRAFLRHMFEFDCLCQVRHSAFAKNWDLGQLLIPKVPKSDVLAHICFGEHIQQAV